MMKTTLSIFILTLIVACGNKSSSTKTELSRDSLTTVNLQDSNYIDHLNQLIDTVTADGWKISYLIKSDSTKYTDIYIRCSKGNQSGTYYGGDLLLFRSGFVPSYVQDSEKCIYFYRRCGTSCDAFLTFKKDSVKFVNYSNVAGYDLDLEEIVYVPDYYYEESSHLKLNAVNLKKNIEQVVNFKGERYTADIFNSVDSIHFGATTLTVYMQTLKDKKQIQEIETVNFE